MLNISKDVLNAPDWAVKQRYKVMEQATWDKFLRNKNLKEKLIATTQQRELINLLPSNFPQNEHTLFWGVFGES